MDLGDITPQRRRGRGDQPPVARRGRTVAFPARYDLLDQATCSGSRRVSL